MSARPVERHPRLREADERVPAALETLLELREYLVDVDALPEIKAEALAAFLKAWQRVDNQRAPLWWAVMELVSADGESCDDDLRDAVIDLLAASVLRTDPVPLATYERMRSAHARIGACLNQMLAREFEGVGP